MHQKQKFIQALESRRPPCVAPQLAAVDKESATSEERGPVRGVVEGERVQVVYGEEFSAEYPEEEHTFRGILVQKSVDEIVVDFGSAHGGEMGFVISPADGCIYDPDHWPCTIEPLPE